MIVATNYMTHIHIVIVDDDREHIGWRAVATQQHHIVHFRVLDGHCALHEILNGGGAVTRRPEADHRFDAYRCIGGVTIPPAPVILR